jgi:hypothetical protein
MICANEISIIYDAVRERERERDGALVFFSNLRFVFIVFYVGYGERERENERV